MKKILLIFVFILIVTPVLYAITSCECKELSSEPPWKLLVLDEEISEASVKIISNDVAVPLTVVLSAYGYQIIWETDSSALIVKDNKEFVLDLVKKTIIEVKSGMEILNNLDGAPVIREVVEQEMWVDRASMGVLLRFMDEKNNSNEDDKNHIVSFGCTK